METTGQKYGRQGRGGGGAIRNTTGENQGCKAGEINAGNNGRRPGGGGQRAKRVGNWKVGEEELGDMMWKL